MVELFWWNLEQLGSLVGMLSDMRWRNAYTNSLVQHVREPDAIRVMHPQRWSVSVWRALSRCYPCVITQLHNDMHRVNIAN